MLQRRLFAVLLLLIVSITSFCSFHKEGHHIKLNIEGLKDTTSILAYYYGSSQYILDTAYVDSNGSFEFKGDSTLDKGMYMIVLPEQKYFDVIIDKDQHFEIKSTINDLAQSIEFSNSPENTSFYNYLLSLKSISEEITEVREKISEAEQGTPQHKELSEKSVMLEDKINDLQQEHISRFPDGLFTAVLKAQQKVPVPEAPLKADGTPDRELLYVMFLEEYWKNVNLEDERILRTPVYHQKLNHFFSSVVIQMPDSIITAADRFIEKTRANEEMFKYSVWFIMNLSERSSIMGMDALFVHMAEKYYNSGEAFWVSEEQLEKIQKRAAEQKPLLIGAIAPNIEVFTPEKKTLALHSVEAKFTVLYFWDSECSHCKKTTPALKEAYNTLKEKDVKVFAMNVESDREKWLNYVEKNNLDWINVHDPVNTSGFRDIYDIFSIPMIFVLDANKKILAKKINPEQVKDVIQHYESINK